MDLYVVKNEAGEYLSGRCSFTKDIRANGIFSSTVAKRKATWLLKRFSHYGTVPTVIKLICTEDSTPSVKHDIECDRCGQTNDYTVEVKQKQMTNPWGQSYIQQYKVAVCNSCKNVMEIGAK